MNMFMIACVQVLEGYEYWYWIELSIEVVTTQMR